jgi:CRP-like cAMP-binding protein
MNNHTPPALIIPRRLSADHAGVALCAYPDQAAIYDGAEAPSFTWIVDAGYVKLHRVSAQGRQATIALLGRGAVFGTIEGQCGTWGEVASAQGDARAYRIDAPALDRLLSTDVEFSRFITRSLGRHQAALQRRLFYVMHRKVESRLAAVLYDLVQGEGDKCVHGGDVDVRLTQQDLADMIGASRQMVSATLNAFRARQIVNYSRDFICVGNLNALATVAEN